MPKEYYFFFYIILAVILLIGVKPAARGEWCEDALSLRTSKGLLGFCAVGIMLHHMSQTIHFAGEDPGVLMFMVDIGVCFVGVFFFFSGYGLYSSLRDKPDYLKGFLRNRLPAILVPFYICNLVFILGSYLAGYPFKKGELLPYLTVVILIQKIKFSNKILDFLGEIALELYLIHNLFLLYMPVSNRGLYIPACYTASILLAVILHMVDKKLIKLVRKRS